MSDNKITVTTEELERMIQERVEALEKEKKANGKKDKYKKNPKRAGMQEVSPFTQEQIKKILDDYEKKIKKAKKESERQQLHRNRLMFLIGCNVALRIQDLLSLKIGDVRYGRIKIREMKNSKNNNIKINEQIMEVIAQVEGDDSDFLFTSRETISLAKIPQKGSKYYKEEGNPTYEEMCSMIGRPRPLSRQQAHKIVSKAAEDIGLVKRAPKQAGQRQGVIIYGNYGCHSLRKSYGMALYEAGVDVIVIKELFNHSDHKITYRYIGLAQRDMDKVREGIAVGI
jgi:integrase